MNLAAILKPYLHYRRWWIAYSGGVDSHVLLHAVAQLRQTQTIPPLSAIHINHQLNPRAAQWVAHCQTICAGLGIELVVETVVVQTRGRGIEAAARAERYAAFERVLGDNELLLQAHHRDDQIETLFLRLLRGAGIAGLASIPTSRTLGKGQLLRPLLTSTRAEIIDYAQKNHLHWIDDDSNANESYDRNFLRLRVLPLLNERWPAYRDTMARVIENAEEANALLKEFAAQDFAGAVAKGGALSIECCLQLSSARQRNLIFYWLQQQSLPLPSRDQLAQVLAIFTAREDAEPCVTWPGVEVRRYQDRLHAMPPLAPIQAFDLAWNPAQPLRIENLGELRAEPVIGSGLRADHEYRVRNRHGGEHCRPAGRAHSQTLKKLLQEYEVPPWQRDRLPIIYCGDDIAAVGDLWICAGFQASAGETGWKIVVEK